MRHLLSKNWLVIPMLWSVSVFAKTACETTPFERNCALLHEIVQVTRPDEHQRRTEDEYARTKKLDPALVKQLFKATGIINCKGIEGTAQLTGKNDVITFAAHGFYLENCERDLPMTCTFALDHSPTAEKIPVDLSKSSLKLGGCGSPGGIRDWGTAKLMRPIDGIRPYDIPSEENPPRLHQGQSVLQVSSPHAGFPMKTIEDCFIKDLDRHVVGSVQHDCGTAGGSSGAAQFIREASTGRTVIGAINVGEVKLARPGSGYDPEKLFNGSVELRGEFLTAVRENMKP